MKSLVSSIAFAATVAWGVWVAGGAEPAASGPATNPADAARAEIRGACGDCADRLAQALKALAPAGAAVYGRNLDGAAAAAAADAAAAAIEQMRNDVARIGGALKGQADAAAEKAPGYGHNADYTKVSGRLIANGDVETGRWVIEFLPLRSREAGLDPVGRPGDKYRGWFALVPPNEGEKGKEVQKPPALKDFKDGDWVELTGQPPAPQRAGEPPATIYVYEDTSTPAFEVRSATPLPAEIAGQAAACAAAAELRRLCDVCDRQLTNAEECRESARKALAGGDARTASVCLLQTSGALGYIQEDVKRMQALAEQPASGAPTLLTTRAAYLSFVRELHINDDGSVRLTCAGPEFMDVRRTHFLGKEIRLAVGESCSIARGGLPHGGEDDSLRMRVRLLGVEDGRAVFRRSLVRVHNGDTEDIVEVAPYRGP